MQSKRLMWILWPSFIVAGAALAVFFTVFDPQDLHFFGEPLELSRMAIYSVGFFVLGFQPPPARSLASSSAPAPRSIAVRCRPTSADGVSKREDGNACC